MQNIIMWVNVWVITDEGVPSRAEVLSSINQSGRRREEVAAAPHQSINSGRSWGQCQGDRNLSAALLLRDAGDRPYVDWWTKEGADEA